MGIDPDLYLDLVEPAPRVRGTARALTAATEGDAHATVYRLDDGRIVQKLPPGYRVVT